ncbi:MAG TPA: thiamine-phosphate kinase [Stenotrophomonas sp.]
MSLDEFGLIERIRRRTAARADIVLGIGDDAALLQPQAGQQLVVTTDTLNAGVHFPQETPAADIGWKALAVNLSDLAAMGAQPAWCSLSLSLPDASADWVDQFAQGFFALADQHGIALIGGDTTRGPLSISITAMGQVAAGQALRRDGAMPGDDIWVSGVPGEAGLALALWQQQELDVSRVADDPAREHLRQRLARPTPRVELGRALQGLASAAVDVSDGLLADLGHICARSGVAAEVLESALPASAAAQQCGLSATFNALRAGAGDDYELCFTAPAGQRQMVLETMASVAVPLTRIGYIRAGTGLQVINQGGDVVAVSRQGYNHFAVIGE